MAIAMGYSSPEMPENQSSRDTGRPLFDFIEALQGKYPTFFLIWNIRWIEGSQNIELFQLIQLFRDHQKSLNPRRQHAKHHAFLTFGEIKPRESNDSTKKTEKGKSNKSGGQKSKKPRCPCGKNHEYKECWYLNENIRPENWKPYERITQKIINSLKPNQRIREWVQRHTTFRLPDTHKESTRPAENTPNTSLKATLSATTQMTPSPE
jgi:hypothetical protein